MKTHPNVAERSRRPIRRESFTKSLLVAVAVSVAAGTCDFDPAASTMQSMSIELESSR